jgi:hypothetical protein
MRQLLLIIASAIIWVACSKKDQNNNVKEPTNPAAVSTPTMSIRAENDETFLTSTYNNASHDLRYHRAVLKELSDSGVFSSIHAQLFSDLDDQHRKYFEARPNYALLYSTPGDLFQNGMQDHAFIVYDKRHSRVSILVYDYSKNLYSELFRDMHVKNGLDSTNCNYGAFGTLDYQVAEELIYQRSYLMKRPENHLKYMACKVVTIANDEDLILDEGCFAKNFSADYKSTVYCIPTSSVYNNWECLTYDKTTNSFIIFYGQAFAD